MYIYTKDDGDWMEAERAAREWIQDVNDKIQKARIEVAREIFEEIFTIIRAYEFDALVAKENYGIMQVRNFGTDILKLKKKYTEGKE